MKLDKSWSVTIGRDDDMWPTYRCKLLYKEGSYTIGVLAWCSDSEAFCLTRENALEFRGALDDMLALMGEYGPKPAEAK